MVLLELEHIPGKRTALESIKRYHSYQPMYYRSNLWMHIHRLVWMIEEVSPSVQTIFPDFNPQKAMTMAAIHDDPEIITGDIQLGLKLIMTEEQREQLWKDEELAIEKLAKKFPSTLNTFSYSQLLSEYQNLQKNNVEGVVAKYIDKLDAFCEALHELHAGNHVFATGFAADISSPVDVYTNILSHFESEWPVFKSIRSAHPFFYVPEAVDVPDIVKKGKPHRVHSLGTPATYTHYDWWKSTAVRHGGKQAVSWLTEQKEG